MPQEDVLSRIKQYAKELESKSSSETYLYSGQKEAYEIALDLLYKAFPELGERPKRRASRSVAVKNLPLEED